ncbi:MAG: fused MFS/spermidine synthase [Rhizobiales bacterium]|nr:fused MFS/spermidine synthase [Hyphomicrobiales bacterium]
MLAVLILAEGLTAFCALGFEITMARLVAPHAGMSTDTWTAIIAAFLLALALGNHIGGRVAAASDLRQRLCVAAGAMLMAALAIAVTPLAMRWWDAAILSPAPAAPWRIVTFVAAPCLPAGLALGIATPLLMTTALALSRSHAVAGLVYGVGATGSVCGVLCVLWWWLDVLGTRATLLGIALVAVALGATIAIVALARPQAALA